MSDTAVYLLSLAALWLASAGALMWVYYIVCRNADRDYFRND